MRLLLSIPVLLLSLSACHMLQKVPDPQIVLKENSIPPSGVYDLSQVAIVSHERDRYEFAAAAKVPYPEERLFALMWCRADEFAQENGYKGWYIMDKSTRSLEKAYMTQGIVQMYRTVRPDGKSGLQKDWCLAWTAPQPLSLENTKPILQYPSQTY